MREESVNAEHHHAVRPLCPCCGGRDYRKGYRHTKAGSRKLSVKARRSKPKSKDHK